jgi:hypothetical protein
MNRALSFKILFLLGLAFEIAGQVLLARGNDFVYQQQPVDFAHWFLLVGVVLLFPQVISFPNKLLSYIGAPVAVAGIVCIIGMCVLDFIWWSLPDQEARNELADHLSTVPSIWKPFITTGTGFLYWGLLILCLNYLRKQIVGVVLVLVGTLFVFKAIPIPLRLVFGNAVILIGFGLLFFSMPTPRKDSDSFLAGDTSEELTFR